MLLELAVPAKEVFELGGWVSFVPVSRAVAAPRGDPVMIPDVSGLEVPSLDAWPSAGTRVLGCCQKYTPGL